MDKLTADLVVWIANNPALDIGAVVFILIAANVARLYRLGWPSRW